MAGVGQVLPCFRCWPARWVLQVGLLEPFQEMIVVHSMTEQKMVGEGEIDRLRDRLKSVHSRKRS